MEISCDSCSANRLFKKRYFDNEGVGSNMANICVF